MACNPYLGPQITVVVRRTDIPGAVDIGARICFLLQPTPLIERGSSRGPKSRIT